MKQGWSVSANGGVINGNVIVDNWSSTIQIKANHFFVPVNVPGFAMPVPEPASYAMLLAGLGLVGFAARSRKA